MKYKSLIIVCAAILSSSALGASTTSSSAIVAAAVSSAAVASANMQAQHNNEYLSSESKVAAKGVIECNANDQVLGGLFGARILAHNKCGDEDIIDFFDSHKKILKAHEITGISYFDGVLYIYYN